ncbi:MAG: ribosomal protein S18-alanine N-acetyltransferase [Clostridia bacterium]|nr:ribosomal protein S18-alanine N-acetyltransferase [Clostridia bacterium]
MKLEIVPMTKKTAKDAAELETLCFPLPWSERSLSDMAENENASFLCALADGVFAGYAGMLCVLDEGQICNVAVVPSFRRLGVGRALMEAQIDAARSRGLSFMTLEVRASNLAAQSLYENQGWRRVGVRKSFYERPREDAYLYDYTIE